MNDNTFWACFWAGVSTLLIALVTIAHLGAVSDNTARIAEYEAATKAGLQQQVIGTKVIWVKIKEQ